MEAQDWLRVATRKSLHPDVPTSTDIGVDDIAKQAHVQTPTFRTKDPSAFSDVGKGAWSPANCAKNALSGAKPLGAHAIAHSQPVPSGAYN